MAVAVAVVLAATGCSGDDDGGASADEAFEDVMVVDDWVYQLQGYPDGRLDALAETSQPIAVIDLARDAVEDYWTADEIAALQASGKTVLAYFEIGATEDFRPEHASLPDELVLNQWPAWPEEYFVRYWEDVWWDTVVQPRLDRALDSGFDGVYLDTPLAYEEIDLSLVPGEDRDTLGRKMVDLIMRISDHARQRNDGFLIVPQNAPELREHEGYTEAIDGLGIEELFFIADDERSDIPCDEDWCVENLNHTRALRDAGKLILAVDYASDPDNIAAACRRYTEERFTGYVTTRALDTPTPPCS